MTERSEWARWSTVIENIKRDILVLNSTQGNALTLNCIRKESREDTADVAKAISALNPDGGWKPVE